MPAFPTSFFGLFLFSTALSLIATFTVVGYPAAAFTESGASYMGFAVSALLANGQTAQITPHLNRALDNGDGGLPIVPGSKDTASNVLATAQALNALTRSTFLSLGASTVPAAAPACTPAPSTTSQPATTAAGAAATLPATGTDALVPGLAGLALVLLGGAAVALSRRPRGVRQR